MIRAGIFIGVDKTGGLQKLNDAAAGARRMYQWALAQGMTSDTHAKLFTDEGGAKVDPTKIADAIDEICNRGAGVEQLIVYFAGHGAYVQRGDRWLLSDAPQKTWAAVNVNGSIELASMSGVPHVVMISDACRVAPEGLDNQRVEGIEIFPNSGGSDASHPVDEFYACFLGRTAAEIKQPNGEAANYSALYTDALLDALRGTRPELLEPGKNGDAARYVRPRPLQQYLAAEIPRRVKVLGLEKKVNQNPEAKINSDDVWVARHDGTVAGNLGAAPRPAPGAPPAPPPTLRTVAAELTSVASQGTGRDVETKLQAVVDSTIPGASTLVGAVRKVAQPFGPTHFESQCGIKVRGARVIGFTAPLAQGKLLSENLLRIDSLDGPGVSVMLRLDDGSACVIPVIREFLAALTFADGDLVDVAYEPSDNSWRWDMYRDRADDVRALRAVAAAASEHGRFRLEGESAERIGRQMQYAKGIDPTLAVYAAHAYHDAQRIDRIREMSGYLRADIGVTFFDLELLSGGMRQRQIDKSAQVLPFLPLLSQGWSLLRANRVRLHPALEGIERTMRDSLWTVFDERGADKIERAMQSREVR